MHLSTGPNKDLFYHFFIRGRGQYYAAWDAYRRFGFFLLLMLFWVGAGGMLSGLVFGLTNISCKLLGFPP